MNIENAQEEAFADKPMIEHHYVRLIRNLKRLEKLLHDYPVREKDCHAITHQKFDEPPFEMKRGVFDETCTLELSKPRKVLLKSTLESYRKLMSAEKQQRIECQLSKYKPNAEGPNATTPSKPKQKITLNEAKKYLLQIERKILSDVVDEIAGKLKRRLPKLIAHRSEQEMISNHAQMLNEAVYENLTENCNPPSKTQEYQVYQNLAAVIGDLVIQIKIDSMQQQIKSK